MDRIMSEMNAIEPREFEPEVEFSKPGELDFKTNAYEIGKDGKVG